MRSQMCCQFTVEPRWSRRAWWRCAAAGDGLDEEFTLIAYCFGVPICWLQRPRYSLVEGWQHLTAISCQFYGWSRRFKSESVHSCSFQKHSPGPHSLHWSECAVPVLKSPTCISAALQANQLQRLLWCFLKDTHIWVKHGKTMINHSPNHHK